MIAEITASEWTLDRWSGQYKPIRQFMERYRGQGSMEPTENDEMKWTVYIENDEADREALRIMQNIVTINVWLR